MAHPESGDDLVTRLLRLEARFGQLQRFVEDALADPQDALLQRVERIEERLTTLDSRVMAMEKRSGPLP